MRYHKKFRVLATITKFRVIISIVLITTLESFGCYILLFAIFLNVGKKAAVLTNG